VYNNACIVVSFEKSLRRMSALLALSSLLTASCWEGAGILAVGWEAAGVLTTGWEVEGILVIALKILLRTVTCHMIDPIHAMIRRKDRQIITKVTAKMIRA
jgi:hypothetical protein